MSDIEKDILKAFIQEARERLQNFNSNLLELEKQPDNADILEEIFREAHTLKGSAKMVGLDDIGTISHKLEDILGLVKKEEIELSETLLDKIFGALDAMQLVIELVSEDKPADIDSEAICKGLDEFVPNIKNKKELVGKVVAEERQENVKDKTFKRTIKQKSDQFRKIDDTVRVSSLKLDNLVNLVGELVISESNTDQQHKLLRETLLLVKKARSLFSYKMADAENDKLNTAFLELNKAMNLVYGEFKKEKSIRDIVIQKLQDQVLDLRLLPVSVVFDAFPRMVHDLASAAKKDVRLILKGRETKLDKKVLEQIKDPVVHIIRNAIDHGFEIQDQRKKCDKDTQCELILAAYQEGESVVIEVIDDGAGINIEDVKKKVKKQELVGAKEAAEFTDNEWLSYIFEPGFTTKNKADKVSGRGIGLDVAKRNIEDLKGIIKVSTELGKYTKFAMKLPLTLAVSRALLVGIAGQKFAIPSTAISETNIISPEMIQTIEGKQTFRLRDKTVGIIQVAKTLGISESGSNGHNKKHLVCLSGHELTALAVDRFYGETEIIVKNAGVHLKNLPSIAGVTIIEGELVPILRTSHVVKNYQQKLGFAPVEEIPTSELVTDSRTILVVEDSLTTRAMEKQMLESAGYNVDEASDGLEALEKINHNKYALLLVDVQMPRMNGLELVKTLRKQKIFESLPIIIVSALDSDEHKTRGLQVGADYYISKKDLLQKDLIEVVNEFIG